jgi:N-formylglutamate amidohydrolase
MPYRQWTFAAILLAVSVPARADPKKLVTIRSGDIPIILSAPHGGREPIPNVPPRKGIGIAQFATVRDDNTSELTELIAKELESQLRGKPFVVIARFERRFVDVNRPEEAALESDEAKPYYRTYHQALSDFTKELQKKWQRGLLLDIHGQKEFPTSLVRGTNNGQTAELLLQRHGRAALTGSKSIFGAFAGAGYSVVPANDSDDKEDNRFIGGHIVRTYGSHQGNGIDAIQLEFGSEFRDKAKLAKTASVLAEAIEIFCREYLRDSIPASK